MEKRTDAEWVEQLLGEKGEDVQEDALIDLRRYLYRVAYNQLYSLSNGFTDPNISEKQVEEFVQETLIRITEDEFKSLKQYKGIGSFTGWVAVICHRIVLRGVSRSGPKSTLGEEDDGEFAHMTGGIGSSPEAVSISQDMATGLEECMKQLPENQRRALELKSQGLSGQEIAEEMGQTRNNVDTLVHRGLKSLKRCLEGKGLTI